MSLFVYKKHGIKCHVFIDIICRVCYIIFDDIIRRYKTFITIKLKKGGQSRMKKDK